MGILIVGALFVIVVILVELPLRFRKSVKPGDIVGIRLDDGRVENRVVVDACPRFVVVEEGRGLFTRQYPKSSVFAPTFGE